MASAAEQDAWSRYLEDTRRLRGTEYEEWEPVCWERLVLALHEQVRGRLQRIREQIEDD